MRRRDYYFGSKHFRGLGKSYFLKVIQRAAEGSSNRKLLGSVVDEIDFGFFGSKQAPKPEHYLDPEIIISKFHELNIANREDAIMEQPLASMQYNLSVKRSGSKDTSANFPGLPVEAGVDIDYEALRSVRIVFGEGTKRLYIRKRLLEQLYDTLDGDDTKIDRRMDDDNMIVNSIVIARNYTSHVSYKREFDAEIEARIEELSNLGTSLKMTKNRDRSLKVDFKGDTDYLVALGGIQWSSLDQ